MMSDWIDFSLWHTCAELERPGIIFEVQNTEQLSIFTPCVAPVEIPHNWKSGPVRFRPIPEPLPQHSAPLPPPIPRAPAKQ